ncbi:hypothetical protein G7046_g5173 [Stylonectria norvegica]|nr:hypothetical protein G7046_g5173 [Stylonectria norvegica]
MSTAARRRLMRDFKRMQTDPPAGVSASPVPDNVMTWNAVIIGPADTPFEDGTFRLVMQFEEQYPNKPPQVKFISQMFHPNVYATGELCLDILQNRWSPTYDVAAVLTSIQRFYKNIPTFPIICIFLLLSLPVKTAIMVKHEVTDSPAWTEDILGHIVENIQDAVANLDQEDGAQKDIAGKLNKICNQLLEYRLHQDEFNREQRGISPANKGS